jgi:hypothetical protein
MAHPDYNALTKKLLLAQGLKVGKVESFNIFAGTHGHRNDLFGFIDYIAINPTHPAIIGVQSTSHAQKGPHLKKITIQRRQEALDWLAAGGLIWLITWKKKPNGRWEPTTTHVTKDLFPTTTVDFL